MSAGSSIEWTDATWNPLVGCSRVSSGCANCYAERFMHRGLHHKGLTRATSRGPVWTGEVRLVEKALDLPLRWRKPRRVFVNSLSDLFHESVPDEWIDRVFAVMALAPRHTFQVLTKRAERMRDYLTALNVRERIDEAALLGVGLSNRLDPTAFLPWPLPNVHLGVSAENQETFDARVADLSRTPAALKFLSLEPLLGPIDMQGPGKGGWMPDYPSRPGWDPRGCRSFIGWVIVGGESGPSARPCNVEWIRDVVRQCREGVVPVFVKQLGANVTGPHGNGVNVTKWRLKSRKGNDPSEWPEDLRVREIAADLEYALR